MAIINMITYKSTFHLFNEYFILYKTTRLIHLIYDKTKLNNYK